MRRVLAPLLLVASILVMGAASDPAERLPNPAQEAHARRLFQQFRCVVCQNESIDDSDADLAKDLRMIVRRQVAAGRSDAQIKAFMVDRYGEFILLKPPFDAGNALLWGAPGLIVVLGGVVFALKARRRAELEAPLTSEEELRLQALAGQEGPDTVRTNNGPRNLPGMT
jgi:cytochrome c-type biogenesis protein CcmH